jgi:ubiquinone biosynthesis protein
MIADPFQIDPQALAAVVPDCYAEFRPVVADGLAFFLRHLSPARLAEVFQAQADLPADAGLPRRLVVFLHACPALHKTGQVLARHRQLDPELRRHLQELESLEPRTPAEQLRPLLARELAPAAEPFRIRADERALAEGSVAVVVPLTWCDPSDGADAPPRRGVAKLLKPGVVERLDEDLYILGLLARYLDERWAAYGLPPLAYGEILADAADLLIHEVRLGQEQANLRLAARQYRGQPDVCVPGLLPFCTDRLTAMEYVDGVKVTDPGTAAPWRRRALFGSAVRALLGGVLFSRDESVLFHGDPHAGNLLATSDGRLALLDWSLAGRLTADDRVHLAQMLAGGWAFDAARVAGAVAGLAGDGCEDLIRGHVEAALAGPRWSLPPGPAWVLDLLDALARAGLRFPPHLLLFRKAFLSLQGVLADVCPGCSVDTALLGDALGRFAWEWPLRWLKSPGDRDYDTHLSTGDLVHLALRAPAAWARVRQRLDPAPASGP